MKHSTAWEERQDWLQSYAYLIYFEPVVTVLLGVTILHEQLTWQAALGALAIATSIVLVNRIKGSRLADSVEIANAPTGENS